MSKKSCTRVPHDGQNQTGLGLEEFVQFVSPLFVEAVVEDLELELGLVEGFTELLP